MKKKLAGLLACLTLFGMVGMAHAANIIVNGSFETGGFSLWNYEDPLNPGNEPNYIPLAVRNHGFILDELDEEWHEFWENFFEIAPTDGSFAAVHGFDGAGPGHITISQNVVIPLDGATLTFDYRAGWDNWGSDARAFNVIIKPFGINWVTLSDTNILTAPGVSTNWDTGPLSSSLFLDPAALGNNQHLNIIFDFYVPEDFYGPGLFQLDNIVLEANPVPIPGAAWLLGSGLIAMVGIRRKFKK